jgi:DnaK suppressor protein
MEDEQAAGLLAAERAATTDRAASLARQIRQMAEEQALTTHDDEHDPEGVTIGYQRAQLQGLLAGAQADLAAIDRATERLRAGRYGLCTRCGSRIAEQRLAALPAALTCIACAQRAR